MESLPSTLQFSGVQPRAFPTSMRINRWLPQGNIAQFSVTDVIRFIINSDGYLDPYSTYLQFEIDFSDMEEGNILQLDGSAHSLIRTMVIKAGSTELERIEEYDVLAQLLIDANYSVEGRASQSNASVGFNTSAQQLPSPSIPAVGQTTVHTFQPANGQLFGVWLQENDATRNPNLSGQSGQQANGIYAIPWQYSFAGGALEPRYSSNVPSHTIVNGKPKQQIVNRAQFCIPLISGILGILMPLRSHKLIPLASMKDLVIELQLNRFAFFSAGYKQSNPANDLTDQYRRDNWKVTKVELVGEVIELEKQADQALKASLANGFVMHTNSWLKGPTFSYAKGESPQGTLQINQGFESLRSIACTIHPLDYTIYNFVRKSTRLSQNINYFQLKVGLQYYPSLAIQGNGGNVSVDSLNPSVLSNAEYIINFQKAFGKYVDVYGDCFINGSNFSVNDRGYDPSKTTSFNAGNLDTAQQLCMYHENRYQGKAVYCLDLETLNYNPNEISGLNTTKKLPYEIMVKSDSVNSYSDDPPSFEDDEFDESSMNTKKQSKDPDWLPPMALGKKKVGKNANVKKRQSKRVKKTKTPVEEVAEVKHQDKTKLQEFEALKSNYLQYHLPMNTSFTQEAETLFLKQDIEAQIDKLFDQMKKIPEATPEEIEAWKAAEKERREAQPLNKNGNPKRSNRGKPAIIRAIRSVREKNIKTEIRKLINKKKKLMKRSEGKKSKCYMCTMNNPFRPVLDEKEMKQMKKFYTKYEKEFTISKYTTSVPTMYMYQFVKHLKEWEECTYFSIGKENFNQVKTISCDPNLLRVGMWNNAWVNLIMRTIEDEKKKKEENENFIPLEEMPEYGSLWHTKDSKTQNDLWKASMHNINLIREQMKKDGGKLGTPHLQIYFQLKNAQTWNTLKTQFRDFPIWFEAAYSSPNDCIRYTQKDGDYITWGQPYFTGKSALTDQLIHAIEKQQYHDSWDVIKAYSWTFKHDKQITQLIKKVRQRKCQQYQEARILSTPLHVYQLWMLHTILKTYEEGAVNLVQRKILWFWDKTGHLGKTHFAHYFTALFPKRVQVHSDFAKETQMRDITYTNDPDYLFCLADIPRGGTKNLNYSIFEMASSTCYSSLKYEGKSSQWKSSQLPIVMANQPPKFWTETEYGLAQGTFSSDRYVVYEFERDENGVVKVYPNKIPMTLEEEVEMYAEFRWKNSFNQDKAIKKAPSFRRGASIKIDIPELCTFKERMEKGNASCYLVAMGFRHKLKKAILAAEESVRGIIELQRYFDMGFENHHDQEHIEKTILKDLDIEFQKEHEKDMPKEFNRAAFMAAITENDMKNKENLQLLQQVEDLEETNAILQKQRREFDTKLAEQFRTTAKRIKRQQDQCNLIEKKMDHIRQTQINGGQVDVLEETDAQNLIEKMHNNPEDFEIGRKYKAKSTDDTLVLISMTKNRRGEVFISKFFFFQLL